MATSAQHHAPWKVPCTKSTGGPSAEGTGCEIHSICRPVESETACGARAAPASATGPGSSQRAQQRRRAVDGEDGGALGR